MDNVKLLEIGMEKALSSRVPRWPRMWAARQIAAWTDWRRYGGARYHAALDLQDTLARAVGSRRCDCCRLVIWPKETSSVRLGFGADPNPAGNDRRVLQLRAAGSGGSLLRSVRSDAASREAPWASPRGGDRPLHQ